MLIFSSIMLIISFAMKWFYNEITYYFIFETVIISVLCTLFLIICFIWNISRWIKYKNKINIVLLILICISFLSPFMPIYELKIKSNMSKYENFIKYIQENQLSAINEETEIPREFKGISINNKALIKCNNPLIVQTNFYIGLSIDSSQFVIYNESDNEQEVKKLFSNIDKLKKIKAKWYYVIAYE